MPDGSLALPLGVAEHCNPDTTPDWPQIVPLIERLVKIAAGHRGEFLVSTVGSENPKTGEKLAPLNLHVPNDDQAREELLNAISRATQQSANNCYVGIALFRAGLTGLQKGREADVVGLLAAVTDWDDKNDPATRSDSLPLYPMAEVETSPGNFQCWYFFDRPYSVAEAKPVLKALARCTGSDSTYSCDHVFRMPGTLNWPSLRKIAKGRSPVPWPAQLAFMSDECWYPNLSLDGLCAAIAEKYPDAFGGSDTSRTTDWAEFDWNKPLKSDYRPLSDEAIYRKLNTTGDDRSEIAYGLIRKFASRGYTPQQALDQLTRHISLPVMKHYADHPAGFEKSLRADIIRAFSKPDQPAPQSASKVFQGLPSRGNARAIGF